MKNSQESSRINEYMPGVREVQLSIASWISSILGPSKLVQKVYEEPTVCTPYDTIRTFLVGNLDYLAAGNSIVKYKAADDWHEEFGFDSDLVQAQAVSQVR